MKFKSNYVLISLIIISVVFPLSQVMAMFDASGSDIWTFVEQTNVVLGIQNYNPSGKYIWINCSPVSNSTLGCIFAFECPVGEIASGFRENGTAICSVP